MNIPYLAGVFDARGSISYYTSGSRKEEERVYYVRVTLVLKRSEETEEFSEEILEEFRGSKFISEKSQPGMFILTFTGSRGLDFLQGIEGELRFKKKISDFVTYAGNPVDGEVYREFQGLKRGYLKTH